MADIDKRLHYFNGQFLQDVDFKAEQDYHLDRQRRHNRLLHTSGIAEGLSVTGKAGASSVTVSPGTAIDGQGQQIVLTQGDTRTLPLNQFGNKAVTALVVIAYLEATSDPATVGGSGNTRLQERPDVRLVVDDNTAPAPDLYLRLARLSIKADGTLSADADLTPRVAAGSRLGADVPIQNLRLANSGDPSTWPVLASKAANEADLTGTLVVSGDLKAGPSGQSLVAHLTDKTNPHATTAAQVGALGSLAGVGPNPTGNVALASGGSIVITPDNTAAKRILISESHSALTGNPHQTLAAQLPDYDLGASSVTFLTWTNANASGSQTTVTLQCQPRILWVSGQCFATLNSNDQYGGVITGFADLRNPVSGGGGPVVSVATTRTAAVLTPAAAVFAPAAAVFAPAAAITPTFTLAVPPIQLPQPPPPTYTQYSFGPKITRSAAGVVVSTSPLANQINNSIAIAAFTDTTVSPQLDITITVKVTGVSGASLTLTFNTVTTGTAVRTFTMNLALYCIGASSGSSGSGPGGGPATS
jgi:hypothetical protein